MYQFKRNQIIIMVLVFMIAVAGYLQFSIDPHDQIAMNIVSGDEGNAQVLEIETTNEFFENYSSAPDGFVEDAQEVVSDVVISKEDDVVEVENKVNSVGYFMEEKMLREQSRSSQIEELTEYLASSTIDEESRSKAAATLLQVQDRIDRESSAESLLRAKGFEDVYVRMDDDGVDVVVNRVELSDEEIAQIEEIVHNKTGYTMGQIRIHMNKN